MPNFKGKFFSIIFIGRLNPQILNHDFLINNKILPVNNEPFKSFLVKKDGNPYTEFISTPVLTTLKYDHISIAIEGNSFQIIDNDYGNPASSSIIQITKKYFGEILKYTPLKLGGINLSGIISFADKKDEYKFDGNLGINRKHLCSYAEIEDVRFGMTFDFPWQEGMVKVQIPKPRDFSKPDASINFNYEFKYIDNMDSFLGNLDKLGQILEKFKGLLQTLGVEVTT